MERKKINSQTAITVTEMADFFDVSRNAINKTIAAAKSEAKRKSKVRKDGATPFFFRDVLYVAKKTGNQYLILAV